MLTIPKAIQEIIYRLEDNGHTAYIVGGAVRDCYLGKAPQDWDIATSAQPPTVAALFPDSHQIGAQFGTISVPIKKFGIVEITTFRAEGPYTDGRHPDYVHFSTDLIHDLSRRDFTCNALAYHPTKGLIDHFGGLVDLRQGVLRSVGKPEERLQEDALRVLRAFRLQTTLELTLDRSLAKALCLKGPGLAKLPPERIGGEMYKLFQHPEAYKGIRRLQAAGLLPYVLPELARCYGLEQNRYHAYTVYGHTLVAMKHAAPNLEVRTALLMHDLGKGAMDKQTDGERRFWGHQNYSAQLADSILLRWAWPSKSREQIVRLVREHMFYWPTNPSDKSLHRFIAKIGPDLILPLLEIRRADIIALGPNRKARLEPWNQLRTRIEKILTDSPVFSLQDLAVDGKILMAELGLPEGPKVGKLLKFLLNSVLSEEVPNETRALLEYAKKYGPNGL